MHCGPLFSATERERSRDLEREREREREREDSFQQCMHAVRLAAERVLSLVSPSEVRGERKMGLYVFTLHRTGGAPNPNK